MENLKYCYMFLECNPDVDETTLRENFFYKLLEACHEKDNCKNFHNLYYDGKSEMDLDYEYCEEKSKRIELDLIKEDVEILCDSYLAVILSRIDFPKYKSLIEGLIQRWDYDSTILVNDNGELNPYFALRFPREDEEPVELGFDYVDKNHYIWMLNEISRPLITVGEYFNSKLAMISCVEQEYMDEHKVLKRIEKLVAPLGRVEAKDEDKIKKLRMNGKMNKNI